jgi:glucose-1-phosphatase
MPLPLLDLGNVVVQVDWEPFFKYLESQVGPSARDKKTKFLKSSLFHDFEFGSIGPSEFASRAGRMFELTAPEDDFYEAFCKIFPGWMPGMQELLATLSEYGPFYCLSNTNEVHISFLKETMPDLNRFTKLFLSHEMKRRKPYPGIYRDVCKLIPCGPKDLVFFDDLPENVAGAKKAGLHAHLYKDTAQIGQFTKAQPKADIIENVGEALGDT